MKKLSLSICIPTYNGARWIGETLESIYSQDLTPEEIIISDDNSRDETVSVVRAYDNRIRILVNKVNGGVGKNLKNLRKHAKGDILFFVGQDDILLPGALKKTYSAFFTFPDVGVVTRPYYWFDDTIEKPVRVMRPYDPRENRVISVLDGKREVQKIFESVGQVSGLAYRASFIEHDFHEEIFPTHIYPFASITKKHNVVFLKDYTIAVRIASSQTRIVSSIYSKSPTESWVKMFKTVYKEPKFRRVREAGIEQIASHFVGLVQIKNYSTFPNLIREILVLIKVRPINLLEWKFWLYALGTLVIPSALLIPMVDGYKRHILSRTVILPSS